MVDRRSDHIACGAPDDLRAWFERWTTEVLVTDRRVIYARGFIQRHTVEINMDKIESVDVDQSVLGRAFNYGDVTIRGLVRHSNRYVRSTVRLTSAMRLPRDSKKARRSHGGLRGQPRGQQRKNDTEECIEPAA